MEENLLGIDRVGMQNLNAMFLKALCCELLGLSYEYLYDVLGQAQTS
jgi:hypothetical protein